MVKDVGSINTTSPLCGLATTQIDSSKVNQKLPMNSACQGGGAFWSRRESRIYQLFGRRRSSVS